MFKDGINNSGFFYCKKNVCFFKKLENKKCWNVNIVNILKLYYLFKFKYVSVSLKKGFEFNSLLNLVDVYVVVGLEFVSDFIDRMVFRLNNILCFF